MNANIRFALSAAAVALLAVASVTTAIADGGNSGNAKLCQKDGWQDLFRADATAFKNAGDCVSYAARGGLFAPASPSNVAASIANWDPGSCTITVDVSWQDNSSNESGFVIGPPSLPQVFPGFPGFVTTGPDVESAQFSYTYGGGIFPVFVWAYVQVGDQVVLSPAGDGVFLFPDPLTCGVPVS